MALHDEDNETPETEEKEILPSDNEPEDDDESDSPLENDCDN